MRIDYRDSGWGHSCKIERTSEAHESGAPMFGGYLFSGTGCEADYELLLKMGSGRTAVFKVTEVRPCGDPHDMFFIKAYPHHYLDEEKIR